jgi:hypothetical protein
MNQIQPFPFLSTSILILPHICAYASQDKLVFITNLMHTFFILKYMYYVKYLDMFWAILCSSSGGQNFIFTSSGIVTLCERPYNAPVESGLNLPSFPLLRLLYGQIPYSALHVFSNTFNICFAFKVRAHF